MRTAALSSHVYERILTRILNGRLKPGDALNRRQMAKDLGVSVAPVLEALLELQSEGLIETKPRKGTRVRAFTLDDVRGQLLVREALECQAARSYFGATIKRHQTELLKIAAELDADDVASLRAMQQEMRFHHRLVSLAATPALTSAYERVMKVALLQAVQTLHPDAPRAPVSSHVAMVRGLISAKTPDDADRLVRQHVRAGKEAIFGHIPGNSVPDPGGAPSWMDA